jgi:hypothetical protein
VEKEIVTHFYGRSENVKKVEVVAGIFTADSHEAAKKA